MNDNLLRFAEKRPEEITPEPISLVISDVPSKVAYDLLTTALITGKDISREEISKIVEARVNGSSLAISFPELQMGLSKMPEILNEKYIISPSLHMHTFDKYGVCECGARRVEIGSEIPDHDLEEIPTSVFGQTEIPPEIPNHDLQAESDYTGPKHL